MHTSAVEAPNLLNQQICGMPIDSRKEATEEPCPDTQLKAVMTSSLDGGRFLNLHECMHTSTMLYGATNHEVLSLKVMSSKWENN